LLVFFFFFSSFFFFFPRQSSARVRHARLLKSEERERKKGERKRGPTNSTEKYGTNRASVSSSRSLNANLM
jgi:hypothetical protein